MGLAESSYMFLLFTFQESRLSPSELWPDLLMFRLNHQVLNPSLELWEKFMITICEP
jgi:hypothetical protein